MDAIVRCVTMSLLLPLPLPCRPRRRVVHPGTAIGSIPDHLTRLFCQSSRHLQRTLIREPALLHDPPGRDVGRNGHADNAIQVEMLEAVLDSSPAPFSREPASPNRRDKLPLHLHLVGTGPVRKHIQADLADPATAGLFDGRPWPEPSLSPELKDADMGLGGFLA